MNTQLPKKTVKEKEVTVRYETWINQQTGEEREFAVVDKPYQSDYNFHKVWLEDLAKVLGILGGAKIKAFSWILGQINPFSNDVGFTFEELSKESKVSKNTAVETVQLLIKADFMRRVRPCQYRVNPKMLVKGTSNKRVGILLKYDELQNRQLDIPMEIESNWEEK